MLNMWAMVSMVEEMEINFVTEDGISQIFIDEKTGDIFTYEKGERKIVGKYTGDLNELGKSE